MLGKLVKGGIDHFALYRALHIGDFFGTFVDEKHFEFNIRIVLSDCARNHLQKSRFARFRRRNDDSALSFADGRYKVYATSCVFSCRSFKTQSFVGINGDEIVKVWANAKRVCIDAVDCRDRDDSRRSSFLHLFAKRFDIISPTQAVLLDFHCRNVGIHLVERAVEHAQEAVSVGIYLEITFSFEQFFFAILAVVEHLSVELSLLILFLKTALTVV